MVHGGNFPVSGAQIYLFAAGQGGYGTSATSLMTSGATGVSCSNPAVSGACYVTTDANGNFALTGDYTCTEGQQVYMVGVGGNPGLSGITATPKATFSANSSTITVTSATGISTGETISGNGVGGTVTAVSGTTITLSQNTTSAGSGVSVTFSVVVNNTSIVQMAALAACPAGGSLSSAVPYVTLNEVTTVAFAYAMSGFATTPYNVSSDANGETALANALANANNIVNVGNGVARAVAAGNSNSILPNAKINSLANILATCVNTQPNASTGLPSSLCSSLFGDATTSTGTAATDEGSAIFNIAHNQAQNVASIFNLGGSTGPFSPTLSAPPTDWTMPVIYTNVISAPSTNVNGTAIIGGPYNIVFDASGNAWIGDRINGVLEVSPQGAVTDFTNTRYNFGMVKGVAVSPQDGSLWISDYGNNQVDVMQPNGTTLTRLKTINQHLTDATTGIGNGPILTAFAPDPAGGNYLAYEATEEETGIVAYDSGTYLATHDAYYGDTSTPTDFANVNFPGWISVDNSGNVWIPSNNTNYLASLTVSYKLGAMKYPATQLAAIQSYTTAADGLGNVWLATNTTTAPSIYYATAGAVSSAITGGGMNEPYKMVIDGNNTVWIANYGGNTVSALNVSAGASKGTWLSGNGFSTSSPGITTTATYSANSTSITVGSSTAIAVGAAVTGSGIPSGTTVSSIDGTAVTLSQATTAAGINAPVTFSSLSCVVIGVDPSGDVWTGNGDQSVTELLGLATPTAAPFYGGNTVITSNGTRNVTTVTKGNLGTKP